VISWPRWVIWFGKLRTISKEGFVVMLRKGPKPVMRMVVGSCVIVMELYVIYQD